MHTAGEEWAAKVASRNEIMMAKSGRPVQQEFLWNGDGRHAYDGKGGVPAPLSAHADGGRMK